MASRVEAYWVYKGPQHAVSKIATATAAQGNILSFPAPYPNSTWDLDFAGPAIRCGDMDNRTKTQVIDQIVSYVRSEECIVSLEYLSWTPANHSYHLPMHILNDNRTFIHETVGPVSYDGESSVRNATLTIYVMAFPGMKSYIQRYAGGQEKRGVIGVSQQIANLKMISCKLHNATYRTNFSFSDGAQSVTVLNRSLHNHVYGVGTVVNREDHLYTEYAYDTTNVRRLAYQSVLDAFGQILVGRLHTTLETKGLERVKTSIMSTILSETSELASFDNYGSKMNQGLQVSVEKLLEDKSSKVVGFPPSVIVPTIRDTRLRLENALEGLFQNITISLMTAPLLQ